MNDRGKLSTDNFIWVILSTRFKYLDYNKLSTQIFCLKIPISPNTPSYKLYRYITYMFSN